MATFATDKLFLDQSGLIALIKAIAKLKTTLSDKITENTTKIEQLTTDLSELEETLAKVAVFSESDELTGGVLKTVKELAEQVKSWITADSYDPETKKTIAVRLDELEKTLSEAKYVTEVTAEPAPDETNHLNLTVSYNKGEASKISIDCSKFVVDGFLSKTYLVRLDGTSAYDVHTGELVDISEEVSFKASIPQVDQSAQSGLRFFVFAFNSDTVTSGGKQYIWVNLEDLHDSYEFEAAEPNYVSVTTGAHGAGATKITVGVSESVKTAADGFGALKTQVEEQETRLAQAETDIKELKPRVQETENTVYNIGEYLRVASINEADVTSFFNYIVFDEQVKPEWSNTTYQTKTAETTDGSETLTGPEVTK